MKTKIMHYKDQVVDVHQDGVDGVQQRLARADGHQLGVEQSVLMVSVKLQLLLDDGHGRRGVARPSGQHVHHEQGEVVDAQLAIKISFTGLYTYFS
jgi:hypothetical protein